LISDDNNRLPIRIKDLAVGSIKADLEEFRLNNSFKIKKIMNISENAEAILKLKKICIHRSKNRNAFRRLTWSKPMTYWDYIQTDALLNIQTQRTTLPDEMVLSCIIK
jgi:hypothetical protein